MGTGKLFYRISISLHFPFLFVCWNATIPRSWQVITSDAVANFINDFDVLCAFVVTGTSGPMAARLALLRAQRQLYKDAGVHIHVRNFAVSANLLCILPVQTVLFNGCGFFFDMTV